MSNHYIAIMAGGIGSRFWPASTKQTPKQFLDILGVGKSLIQMTFDRCLGLVSADRILVITNKRYKGLVMRQLPELPELNILTEPSRNNTAPCIAYTAMHLQARNSNAVFAVLPSDHVVLKEHAFLGALKKAFDIAGTQNEIVTLGIKPNRPDTGYGYIELGDEWGDGVARVNQFKEKPDKTLAQQYVDAGNYVWNAGMFIWSVPTLLDAFEVHSKKILEVLSQNSLMYGTSEEQTYIDNVYPSTPSISVDYAILEKANNVLTIPVDIGWSDLGTWASLYDYLDKDEDGNVLLGSQIYATASTNSIVRSADHKITVLKGLDNFIVINEQDALLIYPKDDEQEIKAVVKRIKGS